MKIKSLNGDQRRQLVNTQQLYEAYREADQEYRRRFRGGMRWGEREGKMYLLRKIGRVERSLGPKNPETMNAYEAFIQGKAELEGRRKALRGRLDEIAPINVAMALGRVPSIAAKILRRCDESGLLGEQITIVGTNAIYAYEAMAGVTFSSELLATGDIDFLLDARRRLSLAVKDVREAGLIGILKRADRTFTASSQRRYRATNQDGYMVELIRPQPADALRDHSRTKLTDLPEDMESAPITGLTWLISAPKVEAVAIDENGLPVRLVAVDPRAFALHKRWLSKQADREAVKKARDMDQARAAAILSTRYLNLPFDSNSLDALPLELREGAAELLADDLEADAGKNW